MNLEWYYTFLVLAKHLNYRKASEERFITQPSLFQQIKKLEQHLHVTLFENVGRGIQLTAEGKHFLPFAQKLIATYEENIATITQRKNRYSMHLQVAISPYIATYLMPKFLPLLFEQEPNMEVAIIVKDNNIIHAIENNTYDIGILRDKPYNNKINCEKICEGKIQLVVPNTVENKDIEDELFYFNKYRILAHNHPVYWDDTLNQILELAPQADIISIEDIKISEQLIASNQGISYLPTYIINSTQNKLLKTVRPQHIASPISFTYLINLKRTPAIERFNTLFKNFIFLEQKKNQLV